MPRSRVLRTAGLLVLLLAYMYPGGVILQDVGISFLGAPFFVWWTVLIGPVAILSLYYLNARIQLSTEGERRGV
ncbi:MAG: hypothetical protein ABEI97_00210 [Candidatus Nanohaloarchaea archaeon]